MKVKVMGARNPARRPAPYVLARHPLAFRFIEKALSMGVYDVKPFPDPPGRVVDEDGWILILDTHSVDDWPILTTQCRLNGGRAIILVNEPPSTVDEEIRLVYLGVHGIVSVQNAENDLSKAVDLIAQGELWISRNALSQYVNRTTARAVHSGQNHFTGREQQIVFFLARGFSNKEIGNSLNISERTVKFHVSNVLQKLNVESRKDLPGLSLDKV